MCGVDVGGAFDFLKISLEQQRKNSETHAMNSSNMIDAIKELKSSVDRMTNVLQGMANIFTEYANNLNNPPRSINCDTDRGGL